MEQYDFDTEQSLHSSTDHAVPLNFPQSNQADLKPKSHYFSATTRRRLIRKPLPNLPSESYNSQPSSSSVSNTHVGNAASKNTEFLPHSAIFARNTTPEEDAITFEQALQKTREAENEEREVLEWWPITDNCTANDAIDDAHCCSVGGDEQIRLDSLSREHLKQIIKYSLQVSLPLEDNDRLQSAELITNAIIHCLATIADPSALRCLQKASSVMWRVDALVRSNEQFRGSRGGVSALLGVLGMRWPRLIPWRGREQDAHSGASTPWLSTPRTGDGNEKMDEEGFPFDWSSKGRSFSSSSTASNATEYRRRKRDVAMQILNNTFWMAGVGAGDIGSFSLLSTPPASKDSAKKGKTQGVAPSLLSRTASPTVAISNNHGENMKMEGHNKSDDYIEKKDEIATTEQSNYANPPEKPSMLTDRLAMQLRTSRTIPSHSYTHPESLESSSSSCSSIQSDAGDANPFRISICRVCAVFGDDDILSANYVSPDTPPATRRRHDNISSASYKSENTIKASSDGGHAASARLQVDWKPDRFLGDTLYLNPLSSDVEGRDPHEKREDVNLIGGTFVVRGADNEHHTVIRHTLDVGVYAACAMLLEQALLKALGLYDHSSSAANQSEKHFRASSSQEPGLRVNEKNTTQDVSDPGQHFKQDTDEKQHRWPHLWGILQGSHGSDARQDSQSLSGSKTADSQTHHIPRNSFAPYAKWGKGLITSFAGGLYKKPLTDQRVASSDSQISSSQSDMDSTTITYRQKIITERPYFISPYRPKTAPEDEEDKSFLDSIIGHQHIGLVILEGNDVSLPFGLQTNSPSNTSMETAKSVTSIPLKHKASGNDLQESSASSSSRVSSKTSTSAQSADTVAPQPSRMQSNAMSSAYLEKHHRDVYFYQRGGGCHDISLGQAIEEMAAKALLLASSHPQPGKTKKEKEPQTADTMATFRIAQYLHGHDKIIFCACLLEEDAENPEITDTPEVPIPTASDTTVIAGALKTNRQVAHTALMLADHLQDAQRLQHHSPDGSSKRESTHDQRQRTRITMWQADMRSDWQSKTQVLGDSTYLSSFGAFVEALTGEPRLNADITSITGQSPNDASGAKAKYCLAHLFKVGRILLKVQVRPIAIYKFFIEGPVVITKDSSLSKVQTDDKAKREVAISKSIRLEVQQYFASVKDELSRLEQMFVARELDDNGNTLKAPTASSRRSSVQSVFTDDQHDEQSETSSKLSQEQLSLLESTPGASATISIDKPLELLGKLHHSIRSSEFALYDSLKDERASLNDVRQQFKKYANATKARLMSWARKHLSKAELEKFGNLHLKEPLYFGETNHAFPGSSYILRQSEPLSIIAYSLSSQDFLNELDINRKQQKRRDVLQWRSGVEPFRSGKGIGIRPEDRENDSQSLISSCGTDHLDPDEDDNEDFIVPEPLRVDMKRKRRTKETGILSLRIRSGPQPSNEAEADTSLDSLANSTLSNSQEDSEDISSTPTASQIHHKVPFTKFDTVSANEDVYEAHVSTIPHQQTHKAEKGRQAQKKSNHPQSENAQASDATSLLPSSAESTVESTVNEDTPRLPSELRAPKNPEPGTLEDQKGPSSPHIKHTIRSGNLKISCIAWFAEDFSLLRKKWGIDDDFVHSLSRSKMWNNVGGKSKSGFYLTNDSKWIAKQLLNIWTVDEKEAFLQFAPAYLRYMMNSVVNDCPTLLVKIAGVYTLKIKDVKSGEVKLKISVQVLENVFAQDGDRGIRFDLKGIRDRRFKPAKSQAQPTASSKSDMQGEVEKIPVWWDGEWIEAMLPRAFVSEQDKGLFRRALHNDLSFLTASNVMDYSLLIGVTESQPPKTKDERKLFEKDPGTFRVRLVDFLGAWTLVKQLESSGKKAIKSQTPTIIPPHDYAARFNNAIENYFIGCPESDDIY